MLTVPSGTGISGIGGGISTEEASVGPGNPPHVPSGLWMETGGTGTNSGISSAGAKGVGVGVANGLGVANGPSCEPVREQLARVNADTNDSAIDKCRIVIWQGFLLLVIHTLDLHN